MIYYLPERIYEVLKDNEEVISALNELEERFNNYDTFKGYMSGYSRMELGDPDTMLLQNNTNNLIKKLLRKQPCLLREFFINNGELTLGDMKNMFNFFDEKQGIDLENKFYLLSNIVNKAEDRDEYERFMDIYVSLYESSDPAKINSLSKYIHLKYMYSKIYQISKNWNDFTSENWVGDYIDRVRAIYDIALVITQDKDIAANYYIEALTCGIQRLNYSLEDNGITTTTWLNALVVHVMLNINDEEDALTEDEGFQYCKYSSGYLLFLDEVATIYCLNGDKIAFMFIYDKVIEYINKALEDKKKLLRGLAYYDKVNHNMFALVVRKYLKISEGIESESKIVGLDDADKEYIMGDQIGEIMSAANPNKLQETRTKIAMDITADAMIAKFLEMKNL